MTTIKNYGAHNLHMKASQTWSLLKHGNDIFADKLHAALCSQMLVKRMLALTHKHATTTTIFRYT